MVLWTIQHRDAYEAMLRNGYLRVAEEYLPEEECFRKSYQWMVEQMSVRIGNPPAGVTDPVWAWYQWEGKRKRPDMRTHNKGYGDKGTPIVLLTIDVPENCVLLSDFDYWHFILNNMPLLFTVNGDIKDCSESEKRESWKQIFDISHRFEGDEDMPVSTQATLWEIKEEWVLKAEYFRLR